jgi:hypothetical protein
MKIDQLTTFLTREWRTFIADAIRPAQAHDAVQGEAGLIERATAAHPARAFLESPVVQDFMARAEAKLTTEMLGLPLDDDAGRRHLAVAIQTQRQLMNYLIALTQDGQSAERELERMRSGQKQYF